MSTCLRYGITPKGLEIKTIPLLPEVKSQLNNLLARWEAILNHTSRKLMKLLKDYHCVAISALSRSIDNLEAGLRQLPDFPENIQDINEGLERLTCNHQAGKSQKLTKLMGNRPKK